MLIFKIIKIKNEKSKNKICTGMDTIPKNIK